MISHPNAAAPIRQYATLLEVFYHETQTRAPAAKQHRQELVRHDTSLLTDTVECRQDPSGTVVHHGHQGNDSVFRKLHAI